VGLCKCSSKVLWSNAENVLQTKLFIIQACTFFILSQIESFRKLRERHRQEIQTVNDATVLPFQKHKLSTIEDQSLDINIGKAGIDGREENLTVETATEANLTP